MISSEIISSNTNMNHAKKNRAGIDSEVLVILLGSGSPGGFASSLFFSPTVLNELDLSGATAETD